MKSGKEIFNHANNCEDDERTRLINHFAKLLDETSEIMYKEAVTRKELVIKDYMSYSEFSKILEDYVVKSLLQNNNFKISRENKYKYYLEVDVK